MIKQTQDDVRLWAMKTKQKHFGADPGAFANELELENLICIITFFFLPCPCTAPPQNFLEIDSNVAGTVQSHLHTQGTREWFVAL